MVVGFGIWNFFGVLKSSVSHQPPILTALAVGLNSSMLSVGGGLSVRVSASLIRIGAMAGGPGSAAAGLPFKVPLGRHWDFAPQASGCAFSSTITSENPRPSVIGYHLLS